MGVAGCVLVSLAFAFRVLCSGFPTLGIRNSISKRAPKIYRTSSYQISSRALQDADRYARLPAKDICSQLVTWDALATKQCHFTEAF